MDKYDLLLYYGSISGIEKLGDECCYSIERSCGQKISNFAFFSIRKERTAGKIRLLLTNIVVIVFHC